MAQFARLLLEELLIAIIVSIFAELRQNLKVNGACIVTRNVYRTTQEILLDSDCLGREARAE